MKVFGANRIDSGANQEGKEMQQVLCWLAATWFVSSGLVFGQGVPEITEKTRFSIGETLAFDSTVLNEGRLLNVYLPFGYEADSSATYPVIYLLDGSADEDFLHIAGLVQFGSFSWIDMIPETIVVGIANVDRQRDFTHPSTKQGDRDLAPTGGGSAAFIDFIENEVQPLIQTRYRINETSSIIGQSLGGLLATEVLFRKPHLFDHYIIVSPSLWWDDGSVLNIIPQTGIYPESIFVGVGKEGEIMESVAKKLFEQLKITAPESTRVYFGFFEQLDHADTLHLAVYDAFNKIFQRQQD